MRCGERLTLLQVILGVLFVDACKEIVVFCVVSNNLELVVAPVADGSSDDITAVLLRTAVEREHHFTMRGVRVACTIAVDNHFYTLLQWLLFQTAFVGPRTIEMAQPYFAAADGQHARGKLRQRDGLLLAVGNLRPCLNHIDLRTNLVADIDGGGILRILQGDACHVTLLLHARDVELGGEVAVSMAYGNGSRRLRIHAVRRIDVHATIDRSRKCCQFCGVKLRAKINILGLVPLVGLNDQ